MAIVGAQKPYSVLYSTDSQRCGVVGGAYYHQHKSPVVCRYWLAGRCNRQQCRFSHQLPSSFNQQQPRVYTKNFAKQPNVAAESSVKFKNSNHPTKIVSTVTANKLKDDDRMCTEEEVKIKPDAETLDENRACADWILGTCIHADNCRFPHCWVSRKAGKDIVKIAQLKEHNKSVTGIVLPPGSNILYTGSKDGTLRACDANTGKCIDYINVGAEVGCILCEQSWVFVGVTNAIWACNTETSQRLTLEGLVGQVKAMVVNDDILFAACEDGKILAYKPCAEKMTFRVIATLKGHSKAVLSLSCSITQLYSGSEDCTIRVWNTHTFQCTHVLEGHSGAVACLITWECFLFSGSLDKTIKVWAGTNNQGIEEIHTCIEEQGVTAFMGMTDVAEKPVLFASTSDNSVRMYELGTERCLLNRGRLFAQKRVTTISCSGRHVFTGDISGNVHVWNWLGEPSQI